MKSVYFRNFLITAVLVFACFLIVSTSFFFLGKRNLISEARIEIAANADEVIRAATALSRQETLGSWNLRMNISSIASSSNKHIILCDLNGVVVSCSDMNLNCPHIGTKLDPVIIFELDETKMLDSQTSLNGFYHEPRLVVGKPITKGYTTLGYVFVSEDTVSVVSVWEAFFGIILAITVAVMMIAMATAFVLSKKTAKPLDDMARAARKFAHGDFSVRIPNEDHRNDEIGVLLDSFNNMAASLEEAEKRRHEFIANISHELRTPMTTIAGFADGLLDGTIPAEDEEKYLLKISDETKRLSRLVRGMLDMAQMENGAQNKARRTKFDISELMLMTLLSFEQRATEKNLDVDPQLPEDPIMILADKDAITQVIYNLLDNAVKFAAPDSTITLRLYKRSKKAYVSVKNCGETIPPDDLPYIFDRFHKSDRSRSMDKNGVGLGLHLVKTILNSHDEDIVATSRDGVTEFLFTLPLAL